MKFGFIPTEGGHYFNEFLEEALFGEELGFDSVWLEEHHSVRNHYWPSPMMGLAGLATRSERILLGTDILVLPFYHPVRAGRRCRHVGYPLQWQVYFWCSNWLQAGRIFSLPDADG